MISDIFGAIATAASIVYLVGTLRRSVRSAMMAMEAAAVACIASVIRLLAEPSWLHGGLLIAWMGVTFLAVSVVHGRRERESVLMSFTFFTGARELTGSWSTNYLGGDDV